METIISVCRKYRTRIAWTVTPSLILTASVPPLWFLHLPSPSPCPTPSPIPPTFLPPVHSLRTPPFTGPHQKGLILQNHLILHNRRGATRSNINRCVSCTS
uniref:Uncharacterized protein n=1 Tax=Cacopsylla melanoneura TaxID=428564 RepID=A0A8D8Z6J4_9HEMI